MKYLFLAALLVVTPAIAGRVAPQVLVGARANQDGLADFLDPAASEADVLALESALGHTLAIDNQYSNWADFGSWNPLPQAAWDIAGGRIPMLSWKTNYPGHDCATWSDIVNGAYDAQLTDQAETIAELGGPVLIRWHYEMEHAQGGECFYDVDVTQDPVTAGQEYIAAWQHVVGLFRTLNVANVQWVWAPGGSAFNDENGNPTTLWQDFYPGDSWVDWIGADIYNKDPMDVEPIMSEPRFVNFYSQVASIGKPLMLSETGAVGPDPQAPCSYSTGLAKSPGKKWISSMSANLASDYPAMKAIVYWDSVGDGGPQHCNNYTLRGDSLTALSDLMSKKYFQKRTLP